MGKFAIAAVVALASCQSSIVIEKAADVEPAAVAEPAAASHSAQAVLDAALVEAKNDDRRVLLVFGATW